MARNVSVIILVNNDGKILLQKRSINAKRSPGKWGFFGGGIEKDEDQLKAVFRETYEELTYKLKNPILIGEESLKDNATMYLYTEKYDNIQEIILGEGDDYKWFDVDDVKDLDMIEHDIVFIEKYKNKLKY